MKKLTIESPCQENWNEFTPKPEGGFCGSCAKIVIDFTNKTNDQIKAILKTKQNQSVCGRIGVNQLATYNMTLAEWQTNQTPAVVQSRFLWALVLAFGFSLFTAFTGHSQETMGKMIYCLEQIDDSTKVKQPTIIAPVENDSIDYDEMIMGEIAPYEDPIDTMSTDSINTIKEIECKKPVPKKPILKIERPIIMGIMVAPPPAVQEIEDSTKSTEVIQKLTLQKTILKPEERIVMGAMVATQINENQKVTKSTLQEIPSKAEETSVGSIFPNPTTDESTLSLSITKADNYAIKLYDNSGKLCQDIANEVLTKGNYLYKLDMKSLQAGQYYVSISSKSHQSTIKLIKN